MRPRILLTTPPPPNGKYYDYVGENNPPGFWRFRFERRIAYGLRFIKQNIPSIEILEFPSWKQYLRRLKEGWDIVGFSFFMNETGEVLKMIQAARDHGIREIWGGQYGALTPEIQRHFDRIFTGYAEQKIAHALGYEVRELVHPPLVVSAGIPFYWKFGVFGLLYTTRGCPVPCTFCQTRAFEPRALPIPLSSIDRVVRFYKAIGIDYVLILDENFGIIPGHAREVAEILDRREVFWSAMTRVDFLKKNLDLFLRKSLHGVLIGVESLNQKSLNNLRKHYEVTETLRMVAELKKHQIGSIGFYIIGLEEDTRESILSGYEALRDLDFDLTQICILTPFPQTECWDQIQEKYGIFEKDYARYDGKHLVWNHPAFSGHEMEQLLAKGHRIVYPPGKPFQTIARGTRRGMTILEEKFGLRYPTFLPGLLPTWRQFWKGYLEHQRRVRSITDPAFQRFFPAEEPVKKLAGFTSGEGALQEEAQGKGLECQDLQKQPS